MMQQEFAETERLMKQKENEQYEHIERIEEWNDLLL